MELRHLQYNHRNQLSQILDNNESWKSLMEMIPRNLADIQHENILRKYSAEQIQQIDETSKRHGRSPTDILLEEWGTSGRTRATVDDLLELLKRVQLYHAANFVAIQILKIRPKEMFEQFHSNVSESNKLFDWTHITLPSEFDSYSNFAYELQTLSKDYERVRKNDENNHGIKQTMNSIISNDGIVPTLSILNGFIYDII